MSNVISLDSVRKDRRAAENNNTSFPEIAERILEVAHKHISVGPVVLLHHLAYLIYKGYPNLSYTFLCKRMGVSRPTMCSYIEALEDAKMIRVSRTRKDLQYNYPNYFEIDFTGPLGDPVGTLKIPKNLMNAGGKNSLLPPSGVVKLLDCIDIKDISNKKLIPKGIGRFATPEFSSISEALEHSEKRVVRKRAEKVAKVIKVGNQITFAGTKAAWTQSMLRHYPSVPPVVLSTKEFCIFKQRILPFLQTDNLSTIFDFFISSWSYLRENKFRWLRAKGQDIALAPSLPELMRYWKVFAQAFADSKMAGAANAQKGERSETEKLRDELAIAKAGRAQLEVDHRNMEERLRKAERMAAAPLPKDDKPTLSLSARRKAADERYNEGSDIPTWK